jgi:hypothetical protein
MRGWIKKLEQRHGMDEDPELKAWRTEEERAERRARFERITAREPLDMDPRRQRALDDLVESFRRRHEQRGA